jgi:4-amino-4-deoxy-L-arabinose transferase-like glycosyltransferase
LKIFRTPGYPALLAPLFWLADEPPVLWARALSAVLSTVAVGLTAVLARMLFDEFAALIAAVIAAISPESVALGVFVLSEAGFAPLMVLNLICWIRAYQTAYQPVEPGKKRLRWVVWSLGAGAAAGLATLMRPSWLLFVPFAGIAGCAMQGLSSKVIKGPKSKSVRQSLAITGWVVVGLAFSMLPWWIRNYVVAKRFVPTTLQVGASLYDGISPTASGASDMRFVGHFVAEQRAADAQAEFPPPGLFEDRLDRRMRQAAVAWAKRNPRRLLELVGIKLLRMWSILPNAGEFQNRWLKLTLAFTYPPVMILALVGAWRFSDRGWPIWLCCLPAIYLTCLHVIFVSSIRYRQPAMLALIVLAAGLVSEWVLSRGGRIVGRAGIGSPYQL